MNKEKVQLYIDKINTLHSSIVRDDEVSDIEKDLLRSYIKKLYEATLEGETKPAVAETLVSNGKTMQKAVLIDDISLSELEEEVVEEVMVEELPVKEKIIEQEVIEETIDEKEVIEETVQEKVAVVDPELAALFDFKEATELSDKLKMLPIKDISKAMSINEKAFTINELFGGDNKNFTATIKDLDRLKSFDEAKAMLIDGIATEQDWASSAKSKKAEHFIQLVKRRFL